MRFLKKLNDVSSHKKKRFVTLQIPTEFAEWFNKTYWAEVVEIKTGIKGALISPIPEPKGKPDKKTQRNIMDIRPKYQSRFLTVSIPVGLLPIFDSDYVLIEPVPGECSLLVRPANITVAV